MIPDQGSHVANRPSVEVPGNVGKRGIARSLCAKSATATLGAAFVVATALLAGGCAEEAEREPEQTVEPKPAARTPRQTAPSEDPPLDGPEFRFQRKLDWWTHALEVLFNGIDLSEEQRHGVDEILEAQLSTRRADQATARNLRGNAGTARRRTASGVRHEPRAAHRRDPGIGAEPSR